MNVKFPKKDALKSKSQESKVLNNGISFENKFLNEVYSYRIIFFKKKLLKWIIVFGINLVLNWAQIEMKPRFHFEKCLNEDLIFLLKRFY